MASFMLLVHSGRYANQSSRSALLYANAIIDKGHALKAVFFYNDGVSAANGLSVIPSDELDNTNGFKQLHQNHNIPLLLCVTAAEKRGILDQTQAEQEGFEHFNIDSSFTVAGLAEMAAIASETDKVVQFK